MNKIRTDSTRSQPGARTTKFHRERKIVRPISNANDKISLMMNERTEGYVILEPLHKNSRALKNGRGRFASVCSVEEFILEHENKNTAQNIEQDVRLLERFLKTKDEDRKIEDIPAVELNERINEFIISVGTKDGNEFEPTSLRSLMASFECF